MLCNSKQDSLDCNSKKEKDFKRSGKLWQMAFKQFCTLQIGMICDLCFSWDREGGEGQGLKNYLTFFKVWKTEEVTLGATMQEVKSCEPFAASFTAGTIKSAGRLLLGSYGCIFFSILCSFVQRNKGKKIPP